MFKLIIIVAHFLHMSLHGTIMRMKDQVSERSVIGFLLSSILVLGKRNVQMFPSAWSNRAFWRVSLQSILL